LPAKNKHLQVETSIGKKYNLFMALQISTNVSLPENEIEISAIRAQGAGGQNVNKVSSAIHLRFDIKASSLPDFYKTRLLNLKDKRISKDDVIIIKAQRYRTQEKNRAEALERLRDLIKSVTVVRKKRISTKPTRAAKTRRMDAKTRRGRDKQLRKKVKETD
jgi:ribosome-associated protein